MKTTFLTLDLRLKRNNVLEKIALSNFFGGTEEILGYLLKLHGRL